MRRTGWKTCLVSGLSLALLGVSVLAAPPDATDKSTEARKDPQTRRPTQPATQEPATTPGATKSGGTTTDTTAKDTTAKDARPDKKGIEFFETRIRPVLVAKCYECHSADSKEVKGGLLLDTREGIRKGGETGPAVVPGHPKDSELIDALRHVSTKMPPKEKLPDTVIADFVKWIEMGAPDPRDGKAGISKKLSIQDEARQLWAYQPVHKPAVPAVKTAGWARTDIDKFLLAEMEKQGQGKIKPVADADKLTLLRRATFALTGLPPTPDEIDLFVKDVSPNAFEKVVDRLLASPHFGERWGRHWLDVARYAESTGKERNVPFLYAWRYRDYVIRSLNHDKPFNQFILEQVAGDQLPAKDAAQKNEQLIATGFLAIGPKGLNERDREKYLLEVVDEQIDVTTRAFMGLTVSCARCHDHKFDPIPTADYYAIAGIFRSTVTYDGVKARAGGNNTYGGDYLPMQPQVVMSGEQLAAVTLQVSQLETRLQELQNQIKQAEAAPAKQPAGETPAVNRPNKNATPNTPEAKRLAKQAEKRKLRRQQNQATPADQSVDKPAPADSTDSAPKAAVAEIVKPVQPQINVEKLKAERDRLLAQIKELKSSTQSKEEFAMAVADSAQPADIRICVRGETSERGPEVKRGFVTFLTNDKSPKILDNQSGRLQLAQWIASPQNPLTARVTVNRIWYHLMGEGIVETLDNFGQLGERPSHPELLDHLATRFVSQGWSVKKTIRDIMLSRSYQLGSEYNKVNAELDPENRLYWRASPRRLDAESIRDAVLLVSGKLDLSPVVGSPVSTLGSNEIGRNGGGRLPKAAATHRSVYQPIIRGTQIEMMSTFDMADPSLVVGQREVTTVPTQALYMMNSPFIMEQADFAAQRLLQQSGQSDTQRVDAAYRWTLGRLPTDSERNRVLHYVEEYRKALAQGSSSGKPANIEMHTWSSVFQALYASGEFRYIY